jgi:hypothetical protein
MSASQSVAVQADPAPNFDAIAIRLADEGIPVLPIARSLRIPSDDLYSTLRCAIASGTLIEMPKDDWPPGSNRASRSVFRGGPLEQEDDLKYALVRFFKTTPLEASLMCLLLRRDQATKEQLHSVVEHNRATQGQEPTDQKMVDVMICKLRKKLKPHEIEIETMWGLGYLISPKHREQTVRLLLASL